MSPAAPLPKAFGIRTTGICRKANTLFHMFHPKILVLIDPENGSPVQGYLSTSWPEVNGLLESVGVHAASLLSPNNFDTVAEREGNTPKSGGSSLSPAFSGKLLPSLPGPASQPFGDLFGSDDEQLRSLIASLQEPEMPPMPQADMVAPLPPVDTPAFAPRTPSPASREDHPQGTSQINIKKRKASTQRGQPGPSKKRKVSGRSVVTRSQDKSSIGMY
jgi:hypothetical protein